jgi:hypothetical protein
MARAYRLVLDGSVAVGPQSAASITIPAGTGGQSYSYELRVTVSEGGGAQSAWTPLATGTVSDALELSQTADGEVEMDNATGTVTVTITSPSWYATYDAGNGPGVFTFDSADLASGPVNLVPPLIERATDADSSGTTNAGDTVGIGDPASDTSYPGLWVYDPDVGGLGAASYQWQADAGGDGNFANLSGSTSSTYTLTSGEAGDDVRVQETLADNGGSRTVSSVAISVEAASSFDPTSLGSKLIVWLDFTDSASLNTLADGTGSTPSSSNGVQRVNDKSTQGNDFSDAGGFGSWQSADGGYVDLGNHALAPAATLTGLTSDMLIAAVFDGTQDSDSTFMLAGRHNSTSDYLGVAEDGSTSGVDANFGSGITYYEAGTEITSPTRQDLWDNWAGSTAKWAQAEAHGVDLSGSIRADNLGPFYYSAGGFDLSGYAKHFIITTNDLTAQELSDLRSWLATEAGA